MLELIVAIDDTDIIGSKGTSSIATEIMKLVEKNNWGKGTFVTRHQLLIHPDIAYTSHNSAMAFALTLDDSKISLLELQTHLSNYLREVSAIGSDPGICIVNLATLQYSENLIEYAYFAKQKLLTKEIAYTLAQKCGVYLSEEGGNGLGVIGSLAAAGLRIDGNDGELKGAPKLEKGTSIIVKELLANPKIARVITKEMVDLDENDIITVRWKIRPILHKGLPVILAEKNEIGQWMTLTKDSIRTFVSDNSNVSACDDFLFDLNDELVESVHPDANCFNCLFRRWTNTSFSCTKGNR